ncbi:hypothetical protein, partial [Paenibacillus radicis (ex Xue et al. 2023)]
NCLRLAPNITISSPRLAIGDAAVHLTKQGFHLLNYTTLPGRSRNSHFRYRLELEVVDRITELSVPFKSSRGHHSVASPHKNPPRL